MVKKTPGSHGGTTKVFSRGRCGIGKAVGVGEADPLGVAPIETLMPLAVFVADGDALADALGDADADALGDGPAVAVEVTVTDGLGVGVARRDLRAMTARAPRLPCSVLRTFGQAFAPGSWVSGHGSCPAAAAMGDTPSGDAVAGARDEKAAATMTPKEPVATETVTLFAIEGGTAAFMRILRMVHHSFETRLPTASNR